MPKSSTSELQSVYADTQNKHPRLSTITIIRGFARACVSVKANFANPVILN